MTKCPKCEKEIPKINLEEIPIHVKGKPRWKGISFNCPLCSSPLGFQIDPIALDADLFQKINARLLIKPL